MMGVMFGAIPAMDIDAIIIQKIQVMIVPAVTIFPSLSVNPFHRLYPAK